MKPGNSPYFLNPFLSLPASATDCSVNEEQTQIAQSGYTENADDCDFDHEEEGSDSISSNSHEREHLRQVFLTKNYVLCHQMKKKFYDMAATLREAAKHMDYEDTEVPKAFCDLPDHQYPLFLTSRQFFTILDFSIADGKFFFPRNTNGSLKYKVISSDYDHEDLDTLLDLENFESDEEDVPLSEPNIIQSEHFTHSKTITEVTAFYFVNKIWPVVSAHCSDKSIDPLLVWMEIKSFIKGSQLAIGKQCGYLSEEEYHDVGRKMAPNFTTDRSMIYKVFEKYQSYLQQRRHKLFDESDMVHTIFNRMKEAQTLPLSIHHFYIDEVQDFTQAELTVLLKCCSDPKWFFFTGDTAQSIMKGIAFRFEDLRSLCLHALKVYSPKSAKAPTVHTLTTNFRSHPGILNLANSITDLLRCLFPYSFDYLKQEQGVFPDERRPVLIKSCSESDLAVIMQGNKRHSSAIEFGAHQAIIVRTAEAKDKLPDILKEGITLTVFESKGLEFDDVLLYDFFNIDYSNVSQKTWRVVSSYLKSHPDAILNPEEVFGKLPPPVEYDDYEKQHKSLCTELKHLYTAVTRAKCNLWIYDSDECQRMPMFEYWHKRGLVKVVDVDDITSVEQGLFVDSSTTSQNWKVIGDTFKSKSLFDAAAKCYHKAGDKLNEKESIAYYKVQEARKCKRKQLYLEAADSFLQCDQECHDTKYILRAAKCLKNGRHLQQAGDLFERLGEYTHALQSFKNDLNRSVAIYEKIGDYSGAVKFLLDRNKRRRALVLASFYRQKSQIMKVNGLEELAVVYAEQCVKQKDSDTLLTIISLIPQYHLRAKFFQDLHLYDSLFDTYADWKQFDKAYYLASAKALYAKGIKLAVSQKNEKKRKHLVFLHAKAQLATKSGSITLETLTSLKEFQQHSDPGVRAQAYLLAAKCKSLQTTDPHLCAEMCKSALMLYKSGGSKSKVGEIESFSILSEFFAGSIKPLELVKLAMEAHGAVSDIVSAHKQGHTASQQHDLQTMENFYGFQKGKGVYLIPADQTLWLYDFTDLIKRDTSDPNGMLCLDTKKALDAIITRIKKHKSGWTVNQKVSGALQFHFSTFPFHDHIIESGILMQSFHSYSSERLQEYLKLCLLALRASEVSESFYKSIVIEKALCTLISPSVTVHLSICTQETGDLLRQSKLFRQLLEKKYCSILKESNVRVDQWLQAWRMSSAIGSDTNVIDKQCNCLVKLMNPEFKDPAILFNRKKGEYKHYFSYWLLSCRFLRESRVKLALDRFLQHFVQVIARRHTLHTISVANLVNILTVFSVAALALISKQATCKLFIPRNFEHVVRAFDFMNCQNPDHCSLLSACSRDKSQSSSPFTFLWGMLDVLLGRFNERYNPLYYAVKDLQRLESGEAHQCTVLVLTTFANMTLLGYTQYQLHQYQKDIYQALLPLKKITDLTQNTCVLAAPTKFAACCTSRDIFRVVFEMINSEDENLAPFKEIKFDSQLKEVKLKPASLFQVTNRSCLTPFAPQKIPVPKVKGVTVSQQPISDLSLKKQLNSEHSLCETNPPDVSHSVSLPQSGNKSMVKFTDRYGTESAPIPSYSAAAAMPFQPESTQVKPVMYNQNSVIETDQQADLDPTDGTTLSDTQDTSYETELNVATSETSSVSVTNTETAALDTDLLLRSTSHPGYFGGDGEEEEEDEDYDEQVIDTDDEDNTSPAADTETAEESDYFNISIPDISLVDEEFCRICILSLVEHGASKTDHIKTEEHQQHEKEHKHFDDLLKWAYSSYETELNDVLQKLNSEFDEYDDSLLETKDVIADEMQKNTQRIEELQLSGSWKIGFTEVEEMNERMDSLISRGMAELVRQQEKINVKANLECEDKSDQLQRQFKSDHEVEDVQSSHENTSPEEDIEIEQTMVERKQVQKKKKKKRRISGF